MRLVTSNKDANKVTSCYRDAGKGPNTGVGVGVGDSLILFHWDQANFTIAVLIVVYSLDQVMCTKYIHACFCIFHVTLTSWMF